LLEPGQTLSHYRVVEKIGEGGMGSVWKALDTRLDRSVALKVLPERVAGDPRALARFEREARAVAALSHPHILAVHDVGHVDGVHFVVMELLEGETLKQRLAEAPLPLRRAVELAGQIARGLAAAHDKGIVHRDLKPDNVFVTRDGQVKLLDFGLAKLDPARAGATSDSEGATVTRQTDPGVVLGTVGYMSPEQVRGREADARSDIFALGVVLYEMVTGKRAFSGDSSVETLNAILKEEPADLQEISREVSPALERIIRHCLEKRPEERFQSARDVAFDLEAHTDPSTSGAVEAIDAAPSKPRIRTLAWLAGAVLLAGGALAAGLLVGGRDRTPELPHSQRITYREGTVYRARFVGDSGTVVFDAAWDDEPRRLYVKRPEDLAGVPLDLGEAVLLSVSPSGELAILRHAGNPLPLYQQGTLARAGLGDNAARDLIENVRDADWSPDGEQLAIVREVDAETNALEFPPGNTLYETTFLITAPRFSPRGDHISFVEYGSAGASLAIVDLQGRHRTLTVERDASLNHPSWSPSGDEVWFTPHGTTELVAVALDGRRRVVARPLTQKVRLHDVSPAGTVLIEREDWRTIIRGLGPGATRERNLTWLDQSFVHALSADGTKLLLTDRSVPGGGFAIRSMDGSTPVKIGRGTIGELSPDGRWVLTLPPDSDSDRRLVLLPTGAGESRTFELGGELAYFMPPFFGPSFDHAGERIVFNLEEEGKPQSYTLRLDDEEIRPLLPEGHAAFRFSPDDQWVYCIRFPFSHDNFERHPVDGGKPMPLGGIEDGDGFAGWAADGRAFFWRFGRPTAEVFLWDPETGERVPWKTLAPPDRTGVTTIARLYVTETEEGEAYVYDYIRWLSELYVVEGLQ
jgi:hypothetical protein